MAIRTAKTASSPYDKICGDSKAFVVHQKEIRAIID